MNVSFVVRKMSLACVVMVVALLPSFLYACVNEPRMIPVFGGSIFCAVLCCAGVFLKANREREHRFTIREGILFLAGGWVLLCALGALPYFLSGIFTFSAALFESASAITTTGISSIAERSVYPRSLLLWHSLAQWLGGVGIVISFLILMPQLGTRAGNLFSAEVQGNSAERTMPKTRDSVKAVFMLYLGATLVMTLLLVLLGQPLLMSLNVSMATLSTAGFIHMHGYLSSINSIGVELVILVFMFFASINFVLFYRLTQKQPGIFWKDTECKWYIIFIGILTGLITLSLWINNVYPLGHALREALFQTVAIMSTTGFASTDYSSWPPFTRLLLFYAAIIGGCSGSTAGGVRISRMVLMLKVCWLEILRTLHPRMVQVITMSKRPVPSSVIGSVGRYFFLYFILFMLLSCLYALTGTGILEAMSTVVMCLSNIGGAYGLLGEAASYVGLSSYAYFILFITMILGRIELFTLIMLVYPDFWTSKRNW